MENTNTEIDSIFQVLHINFYKLYIIFQTNFETDYIEGDDALANMFFETISLIDGNLITKKLFEVYIYFN